MFLYLLIRKPGNNCLTVCCYLHQPTEISVSHGILSRCNLEVRTSSNLAGLDLSGSSKTKNELSRGKMTSEYFRKLLIPGFGEMKIPERAVWKTPGPCMWKHPRWKRKPWLLYHETWFSQKAWNLEDGSYHPTKPSQSLGLRIIKCFSLIFFPRSCCLYLLMTINTCCVFFLAGSSWTNAPWLVCRENHAKINFQIDATPNSSPLKKWWEITFLLGRPIIQLLLFESDLCKNIIQKTVPGPSKSIQ